MSATMAATLVERCLCIACCVMDQLINRRFGERIYGFTVSIGRSASTAIQASARIATSIDPPST